MIGRPLKPIEMTAGTRRQLESRANSRSLPHSQVVRARVALMAADGVPNGVIATAVGLSRASVGK